MEFIIGKDAPLKDYVKNWQFSVGSCHAPLAHRKDYLEQLKFVHEELGFKRVRFHGIFNDDMNVGMCLKQFLPLPSAKKFKEVSFYQVGKVYDNLLEIGIRPFVEVGFMPGIFASGKRQCNFSYGGNITMPKDMREWSEFIKSFIRFLIDRYGKEEISNWYFEIWNEPDLPVFFAGSKKDYFKLYDATSRAIKEVCPECKVGGPATSGYAWLEDFTAFLEKSGAPCDFISTHQYSDGAYGGLHVDMSMIKGVIKNLRTFRKHKGGNILEGTRTMFVDDSEIKPHDINVFTENARTAKTVIKNKPLLLTEWGVNATCTAEVNNTIKSASYIVKTMMDSDGILDGCSYWCFSDIFEELLFYPYEFSGAFGMITIDGIPKPQFWGFKLLGMLGDKRMVLDNASQKGTDVAAFRKGNNIQTLVYKQNFKQVKETPEKVTLKIECDSAPKNVYIYKIDEDHCNPYRLWQEAGSVQNPDKEQIEEIKRKSALLREDAAYRYENGVLIVETDVSCNSVRLIEAEI